MRVPLLTLLGAAITVGIVAGTGCAGSSLETLGPGEVVPGSSGSPRKANSIEIPVDLKKIEELQRAFEDGHQPWRGDPLFVAHVAIIATLDRNVRYEDLKLERETETEAVVAGKGTRYHYKVHLERLVTPGWGRYGIWTAVRIGYELAGE